MLNKTAWELFYFILFFSVPGYEAVDASQWNGMLDRIDLNDPGQKETAAHITSKFSSKKPAETASVVQVEDDDNGGSTDEEDNSNNTAKVFYRDKHQQALYDKKIVDATTGLKLLGMGGIKNITKPKELKIVFVSFNANH